ncbi:MAG: hypothetical protein DRI61_12680, partial [Chloroflexi bacterium]
MGSALVTIWQKWCRFWRFLTLGRSLSGFLALILLALGCAPAKPTPEWHWEPIHTGLPTNAFALALAVNPENPEEVWAATYGDVGLFHRDRAGKWAPVRRLPPGPCFTVLVDHRNPKVIYVGTSQGVFWSRDGGKSWAPLGQGLPPVRVYALAQAADGTLYAAPDEHGIYRLDGDQWHPTAFPSPTTILSLLAHPQNPLILYAGTGSGAIQGVLRTSDGGRSWQVLSEGTPMRFVYALAFDPQNANRIYVGAREGFFVSPDGGKTWRKVSTPFKVPAALLTLPSGTIYAGELEPAPLEGRYGVYRSEDGGNSWVNTGQAGFPPTLSVLSLAGIGSTIYAGSFQGVFLSRDGGRTWEDTGSLGSLFIPQAALSPWEPDTIYACTSRGLYRSRDAGESWEPLIEGWGVESISFHPTRPGILYAGVIGQGAWLSYDYGSTWQPLSSSLQGLGIATLVVDREDEHLQYALIVFDRIYRSTDGGESWHSVWEGMLLSDEALFLAQAPHPPYTLWAGTREALYRSDDKAARWERVP